MDISRLSFSFSGLKRSWRVALLLAVSSAAFSQDLLIEAESFTDRGGWVVDQQFVEQMGSPYLLAHGLGKPVSDARTSFVVAQTGKYHIWVRTMNWVPGAWAAPGRFQMKVDDTLIETELGTNEGWSWQYVGYRKLAAGQHALTLLDRTGFDGRCDAVFFSTRKKSPPNELEAMKSWRARVLQLPPAPERQGAYDLVVVGGGLAGCAAAISAAEEGLRVALIHDRPVLGGNASGEIRVHTLGIYGHFERILKMIDTEHYPNGDPRAKDEDVKRLRNVRQYSNIDLFLNWRAYDAHSEDATIKYVDARHSATGERMRFVSPFFADCTGDGWIGYWAGAEFMYGRESADKFDEGWDKHGEIWSPQQADHFVMGSSVLWRTDTVAGDASFPEVPWAMDVAGEYAASKGEWQWEFTRNDLHQIDDAEAIRDHMLRAIYGSFYNFKKQDDAKQIALAWVSPLIGKRESRRLVGDHIYTFNDVRNSVKFPDSVVVEERAVDVHYQRNLLEPAQPDFISEALFYQTDRYYVPYRSLYSKNINNLFMAGRCFSCSHIGLGGPRVMRTTGQMGAAVGYAAVICKKYETLPRQVFESHLEEYMQLVLSSNGDQ